MADQPTFPNSLRYAREQRKLSLEQVATELNTSVAKLVKMEEGDAVPTVRQYEALSSIYGVQDYVLASESRPEIQRVVVDLRQSVAGPMAISPKGLKAFFARAATARLIDSIAQSLQLNPKKKRPRDYTVDNIASRAVDACKQLDFDPRNSFWIQNPHLTFRYLRAKVEDYGVYCFLSEVPPTDYRGLFAKLGDRLSLILINKKTFKDKARLFTLIHEFAHYLIGVEGISDPMVINNDVERACNKFASSFLAPPDYFKELYDAAQLSKRTVGSTISFISTRCLLSYGAVAFRLKADGLISEAAYRDWYALNGLSPAYGAEDPAQEVEDDQSPGGNWAYNVVTDLGFLPFTILEKALGQGAIDDVHVGQIVNARAATQEKAFKTAKDRLAELGL